MKGVPGQMNMFDLLNAEKPRRDVSNILSVGNKVGRVVLGECRIATITEVEGFPYHPFYRTDSGCCYEYDEGLQDIDSLIQTADRERVKYKTILPKNLEKRITVEYAPRLCDGVILWGQIGIIDNMLFWKEWCTYQFLVPYDSRERLMKEYEKHKKNIMEREGKIVDYEKPMRRLYWSIHGFYADAEYVHTNG